jgi:ribonuclease HI
MPEIDPPCWTAHCDGSAMPNPGKMGLGVVLSSPDGQCHTLSRNTHAVGCNNEAELRALMAALAQAQALGVSRLAVFTDNHVLVDHLVDADGRHAGRPIERLAPLFDEARALMASFEDLSLRWVPRHRNAQADALARAALGMGPKVSAPRKKRR